MRLAIVGSRYFNDFTVFKQYLDKFIELHGIPELIVSGGCRGGRQIG